MVNDHKPVHHNRLFQTVFIELCIKTDLPSVVLGLRTYAIWDHNRIVLLLLLCVGASVSAVAIVCLLIAYKHVKTHPYNGSYWRRLSTTKTHIPNSFCIQVSHSVRTSHSLAYSSSIVLTGNLNLPESMLLSMMGLVFDSTVLALTIIRSIQSRGMYHSPGGFLDMILRDGK